MNIKKQIVCLIIFFTNACGAQNSSESILTFMRDLQRCYYSAGWICKDFARMDAATFVLAWHQLSDLFACAPERWFYAHNTPHEYALQRANTYSTIERYLRESSDMFWITECRAYHQFLQKRAVHVADNRLVDKKDLPAPNDPTYHDFVPLQDFIAQYDPGALINFYQFFFEQLVNVILYQLNYLYEDPQLINVHIATLMKNTQELEEVYHLCCHKVKPSAQQARALAYHYERTQSVIQSTVMRLLARLEDPNNTSA